MIQTRPIEGRRASVARAHAIACALALVVAVPATVAAQTIRARADGLLEVTDVPPGTVVRYTLDGTDPTRDAGVWLAPVSVPAGYTVKAPAFTPDHTPVGTPGRMGIARDRPAHRVDTRARDARKGLARL